jgi:dihydrofolate reductase
MGPYFAPELGQAVGSLMGAQDAILLGRVTYQTLAAHWPQQTGDLADTMNNTPKYVVSGTLKSADWRNSTLIPAASAFAEIAALKQQPGRNIGMTGSGTLTASLLRQGLLDELHLFVFPLVLGSGQRLFGAPGQHAPGQHAPGQHAPGQHAPGEKLPLKLLGSAAFPTGVMHLTYAKA